MIDKRWLWMALVLFCASCTEDEGGNNSCNGVSDFVAVWNISEQCGSNDSQYALTVTENSSGGIKLSNLGGLGAGSYVDATVNGASFTIPPQTVQGMTFSGNGSLNAGCLQLTLIWTGSAKGNCSGNGTK